MAGKSLDLNRLCGAIQGARTKLKWDREQHAAAVRHSAGSRYSSNSSRKRVYVNFAALYLQIVGRKLVAKNPRAMLSTFERSQEPAVEAMQSWLNEDIERINLASTLLRTATDALYTLGITKVGLATPADSANFAWNVQAGEPFARRVDLDDFVFDVEARDFDEVRFIGHRIRVPLEVVKESRLYHKVRKDLAASEVRDNNPEGDEKIRAIGRGHEGSRDEVEDMVDLWEIYCPRRRCLYTLSEDCLTGAMAPHHNGEPVALREADWVGPDCGPYHILGFGNVSGNIMPKGPLMDLLDLDLAMNQIMRKLVDQAENQKDVVAVGSGNDKDAETIRDSNNLDILKLDRPGDMKYLSMGGPNQLLFQFFLAMKEIFSWFAGNLDLLGGLSPQSKTASQDAMLNANSSENIAGMQSQTVNHATSVLKALCWYHWHDPYKVQRSTFRAPGLKDVAIERRVYPWNHPDPHALRRTGNWEDLNIKVDPYSLAYSTPQQRARDLNMMVQQTYLPLAMMFERGGRSLDLDEYLDLMSKYLDNPDVKRIFTTNEPPAEESAGGATEPERAGPMPAMTERRYVRENRPGRSRANNDMMLMNALAGVDGGGAPGVKSGAMQ